MGTDCRLGLLGTVCLFATGCFSYGPYGHPGTFAPPHSAMVPQPYGTAQIPPDAVWIPASPVAANTLTAPNPIGKSAPTSFEDDHESSNEKPVPAPTEPGKAQPQEATQPFGLNDDAKLDRPGLKTSQRARPRPLIDESFTNTSATDELDSADSDSTFSTNEEPVLPRSGVRSAEFRTQVRSNAVAPASATDIVDEFGYDATDYSWLRGILEYDPKHKSWHLIYSESPDDTDRFGGEVTLKNPEHFRFLRNGQAVSIEGQFDTTQRDRLGKFVYEATEIVPAGSR